MSPSTRCTWHRDGIWCGRLKEDQTVHVGPSERMKRGFHVWRHDKRDAAGLPVSKAEKVRKG